MSDKFNTAGFNKWWAKACQLYNGDSKLCALRAWQHQQATITELTGALARLADSAQMSDTQIDPLTSAVEAKARIAYARAALKKKTKPWNADEANERLRHIQPKEQTDVD